MKSVVAAFNQEKALVGAFSVITNLRMELFEALNVTPGSRTDPRLARKWQEQVTRTAPAAAVKQGAVAPVGGDMETLGSRRQETELDTIKLLPS